VDQTEKMKEELQDKDKALGALELTLFELKTENSALEKQLEKWSDRIEL